MAFESLHKIAQKRIVLDFTKRASMRLTSLRDWKLTASRPPSRWNPFLALYSLPIVTIFNVFLLHLMIFFEVTHRRGKTLDTATISHYGSADTQILARGRSRRGSLSNLQKSQPHRRSLHVRRILAKFCKVYWTTYCEIQRSSSSIVHCIPHCLNLSLEEVPRKNYDSLRWRRPPSH